MKIAYVTAGAAGMYCGTCLHDNTLAAALMRNGHEVSLLPTYTPTRTDEPNVAGQRVFFGALNVYLQQKSRFFRGAPRFFDRWLDNPKLLGLIGKLGASSTNARDLGELTLSMLRGADGFQAKALDQLCGWLADYIQPDVVHLSSTLFAGFAERIKARVGVPVVCSLQGEDLFFDELIEPYRSEVRRELRRRLDAIDLFTSPCDFYSELMSREFGIPAERTVRARLGIDPEGFLDSQAGADQRPPTVGFLARNAPEKGLHLLIEAFQRVAERDPACRLRIAGFQSAKDRAYLDAQRARVAGWGFADRVDWVGEVDRQGKFDFLTSLDLLSVPTIYREPKGLFVAEALASAVPVLLPDHGAFPEWIAATGGGGLHAPGSATALADAILEWLARPEERRRLGRAGREAVLRDFNDQAMAEEMLGIYERILGR
jgi:glycosyltransferase involved in cell wall biosynthesis